MLTMAFALMIIAKLDVSFFEANGMIANEQLREAFYYNIFEVDPMSLMTTLFGLAAVGIVAAIFAHGQTNYFKRLGGLLNNLANSGEPPVAMRMGGFTPYIERFLNVVSLRMKHEREETIKTVLGSATRDWPLSPKIAWFDQLQFAAGAGALAILFSFLARIYFVEVNDRVVELSYRLVRFKSESGPRFFAEQIEIVNLVGYVVFGVMTAAFIVTGYRFSRSMSNSSYSCLRDLKRFMEGNFRQRLLLRSGDLGKEHIPQINKALDKIASKLEKGSKQQEIRQENKA